MLDGKRVLIVEDEWLLADHIGMIVEGSGGAVIGPAASVPEALALLAVEGAAPDAATLNIKLEGDLSYPVADRLVDLGIPYVFVSANERQTMPERFQARPMLAKPFTDRQVVGAIARLFE